jgi:hypothetical protein
MTIELSFLLLAALAPADQKQLQSLMEEIAASGRVLTVGEVSSQLSDPRHQIAPGAPPLLAFRYFEGAERHRFGKLDLVLDDAGH